MTNEEMKRNMEDIVEQQAQVAAKIQRLQEERNRDTPHVTRLEESFQLLVRLAENSDFRMERLESTTTALESTTSVLESTTNALESTTNTLASNMVALAAAQTQTNERLTALIDIVREGNG